MRLEDGVIREVRIALGGVAHKPWRASIAEQMLAGSRPSAQRFAEAAAAELAPAVPRRDNAFKVELAKRTIVSVLSELAPDQEGSR
jgi:xanthine dehydrogenase YagS FAD-binding subunit